MLLHHRRRPKSSRRRRHHLLLRQRPKLIRLTAACWMVAWMAVWSMAARSKLFAQPCLIGCPSPVLRLHRPIAATNACARASADIPTTMVMLLAVIRILAGLAARPGAFMAPHWFPGKKVAVAEAAVGASTNAAAMRITAIPMV